MHSQLRPLDEEKSISSMLRQVGILCAPQEYLVGMLEGSSTGGLLLLDYVLLLCSVQDLEELADSESHSRVHVGLGALDVVVEIVSEDLNVRDTVLSSRGNQVSREEHKGDVTHVVGVRRGLDNVPDLQRRLLLRVQHLGGVLDGSSSSIHKFLQEDLSEDSIGLVLEDGGENDGDSVVAWSHVNGLLVSVVDCHDLVIGLLGSVQVLALGSCLLSQLVELVKSLFEWCSKSVSLQQSYLVDQLVSLLGVRGNGAVCEVEQQRNIVARLGLSQVRAVLSLQNLLGAALDQILKTLDVHGHHDDGLVLGVRVGDVEGDIVKVGHHLVDAQWRGFGVQTLAEHRLQQQVLVLEHKHFGGCVFS